MKAPPVPPAGGPIRLVGLEELSASALRTRLLGAAEEFWAGAPIDGDAVRALAVHPAWRRRGVATRLLERFAALAARLGARAIQAVVLPDDRAARELAARFGA